MGYNLKKRISVLKKQTEGENEGKLRWSYAFFASFFAVAGITSVLWLVIPSSLPPERSLTGPQSGWHQKTSEEFDERLIWLDNAPPIFTSNNSDSYYRLGRFLDENIDTIYPKPEIREGENEEVTEEEFVEINNLSIWIGQAVVGSSLRLGFVTIAFWPLWLISGVAGLITIHLLRLRKKEDTILTVCDRKHGPFYSGIYGPLLPNQGVSGTDLSCPSLACPPMETKAKTLSSSICDLLREYDALNETNIALARIILAHHDFPSVISDEDSPYLDSESTNDVEEDPLQTGLVSNESGSIKISTLRGLAAILEAHKKVTRVRHNLVYRSISEETLDKKFDGFLKTINKVSNSSPPLGKLLLHSLTPRRFLQLGHLPATLVATAYLSTEAGKSLVYKRRKGGFEKISNYPHLQARAVVQSIPAYHREYNGDQRLIIRQAILCSRRHADFGRAFLPYQMPNQSRALRDWLEISYGPPNRWLEIAQLVELDGHIEELAYSWKKKLKLRFDDKKGNSDSWKGFAHKSVVLMPFKSVLQLCVGDLPNARRFRIIQLLRATHHYRNQISINSRLPGFKKTSKHLKK